jgi:predicted HicB family RNase H-like nuclease
MNYKGYRASVGYDKKSRIFSGEVADVEDVIVFQAKSEDELERRFQAVVADYLAFCAEQGIAPDEPGRPRPYGVAAMEYRGYTARVACDLEERGFFGHIDGIRDIVNFIAPTVPELEREFRISVDVYLECCAEDGLTPEVPVPETDCSSS